MTNKNKDAKARRRAAFGGDTLEEQRANFDSFRRTRMENRKVGRRTRMRKDLRNKLLRLQPHPQNHKESNPRKERKV